VKNRFRLFRSEADFQRHVAADRGDGLLAVEDRLARENDGRGWARDTVERLCVDRAGKLLESCDRDGTLEDYLVPRDHRIGVGLAGTLPANTGCAWSLDDGTGTPRQAMARCDEEVKLRIGLWPGDGRECRHSSARRHRPARGGRHSGARHIDRRIGRLDRGRRRQSRSAGQAVGRGVSAFNVFSARYAANTIGRGATGSSATNPAASPPPTSP